MLRPIIAGPACPTHRLSHFIDVVLQPFTNHITAFVNDDFDILRKLPKNTEKNWKLATFGVENLYGNITHDIGLEATKFWLNEVPLQDSRISKEFIVEGIKLILENNMFFLMTIIIDR